MKHQRAAIWTYALLTNAFIAATANAQFVTVDLATLRNVGPPGINPTTHPTGPQEYGCVPFAMPASAATDQLYMWWAGVGPGPNPVTLSIPLSLAGVDKVYTIMNTAWGSATPNLLFIDFIGSGGAMQTFELRGNRDIRDHHTNFFTNAINNTTTVNAWENGLGQRLDRQAFDLSADFLDETLVTIRIRDFGGTNFSRAFIVAVTAELGQPTTPGDMNCDGFITVGDIGGFVLALTDLCAYFDQFPNCEDGNADVNGDGFVSVGDIGAFVALLTSL